MTDGRQQFTFDAGTKLADFVTSNRFCDIIMGPLGSGKSVAACLRIMRHAQEQKPSPLDGLRKTRWAIVRNSYPDLKRTTIRTWVDTFPESLYGRFFWGQPPGHKIAFPFPGGDVRLEVDFLALDKPEDIRKLRSGEYTGVWFNELSFIDKELFDEATSRVDRYPKKSDGGPTWTGIICDTNPPAEDHWLGMLTGLVEPPPGLTPNELEEWAWPPAWGFHMQPPALIEHLDKHGNVTGYDVNPRAENLKNLSEKYYANQIASKSKSWIDSHLMVRITLDVEGSPVYPMFRREYHVAAEVLRPMENREVLVSIDFGRSPGALFSQEVSTRTFVQGELTGENEAATSFAPRVKHHLEKHYPGCPFRFTGDPKGRDKGQANDQTAFEVFEGYGMKVTPAPVTNNSIKERVEAVSFALNDNPSGAPNLVISPICRTLIVGLAGRYFNEKDETGELKPCKNRYSHVCNALEYKILSRGVGRTMRGLTPAALMKPVPSIRGHAKGVRRRVG